MASCYLCAAHVRPGEGFRRQVMTSQQTRVYFSKRGGGSYGQTHALRTLCSSCAAGLDRRRDGQGTRVVASFVAALIGCIIAVRMRDSVDGSFSSLIYAFFLFGGAGLLVFLAMHLSHSGRVREKEASLANGYLESEPEPAFQSGSIEQAALTGPHSSEAEPEGESYPGIAKATQSLHGRLKQIGVSLMGCYGFPENLEGARQVVSLLNGMHPVRHFGDLGEWEAAMCQQTLLRFSKDAAMHYANAKKAQDAGSDDDFIEAFKPMFQIFPMLDDEDFQPYLNRLGEALSSVSELIEIEAT